MASYTVKVRGSEDVKAEVLDNPSALNTARAMAMAIAIAKIRVGDVVEVWAGNRRRLSFVGREVRAIEVRRE